MRNPLPREQVLHVAKPAYASDISAHTISRTSHTSLPIYGAAANAPHGSGHSFYSAGHKAGRTWPTATELIQRKPRWIICGISKLPGRGSGETAIFASPSSMTSESSSRPDAGKQPILPECIHGDPPRAPIRTLRGAWKTGALPDTLVMQLAVGCITFASPALSRCIFQVAK